MSLVFWRCPLATRVLFVKTELRREVFLWGFRVPFTNWIIGAMTWSEPTGPRPWEER